MTQHLVTALFFLLTVGITYASTLYARAKARNRVDTDDLAERGLNRWLVGLSAATTGNSGFIVTGAVGLGYTAGVHWLLLPLSWLLGDLCFWALFPARLNQVARETSAVSIADLLAHGLKGFSATVIPVLTAAIVVVFLGAYVSAQWVAGQKFLLGTFDISGEWSIGIFAAVLISYSAIGGFQGSVFTDMLQAVIRIAGTVLALAGVIFFAVQDPQAFRLNIAAAGPAFLDVTGGQACLPVLGFVVGYALAAIGFGLGQPQIMTRYFAGKSPSETRAAKWIYIGFLQFTWLAMTAFGVILRGVMPGLADGEQGLSIFFNTRMGSIATGVIVGDIFCTIASTANGILVAMAQSLKRDVFEFLSRGRLNPPLWAITISVGLLTVAALLVLHRSVFSLAIMGVSLMAASLAGPVMIKVFAWRHDGLSLLLSMVCGLGAALAWRAVGYNDFFNESGLGIAVALIVNGCAVRARPNHAA